MPELRSGARQARLKSKKLEDLPNPNNQVENLILPAPNRGGRRGAGRGNKAAAAPRKATRARGGGRGRGVAVIDLDPDQPCEVLPGAGNKKLAMDGESADKLVAAEEEPSTAPVPERVCIFFFALFGVRAELICMKLLTGTLLHVSVLCANYLLLLDYSVFLYACKKLEIPLNI